MRLITKFLKRLANRQKKEINFLDYKQKLFSLKQLAIARGLEEIKLILEKRVKNDERACGQFLLIQADQSVMRRDLQDLKSELSNVTREIRVLIMETKAK